MVNRVSSYFPKGGHSATETETLTPKTGNREPQQNYRLGTVSNELLGGGGLNLFYVHNLTLKIIIWKAQGVPQ